MILYIVFPTIQKNIFKLNIQRFSYFRKLICVYWFKLKNSNIIIYLDNLRLFQQLILPIWNPYIVITIL